jgi:hypothetical protein
MSAFAPSQTTSHVVLLTRTTSCGARHLAIDGKCPAPIWLGVLVTAMERRDNSIMILPGHVPDGVIVLEVRATLPEGTPDSAVSHTSPVIRVSKNPRPVKVPLVPSSKPGSLLLTGEMIAATLDEDDLSS